MPKESRPLVFTLYLERKKKKRGEVGVQAGQNSFMYTWLPWKLDVTWRSCLLPNTQNTCMIPNT